MTSRAFRRLVAAAAATWLIALAPSDAQVQGPDPERFQPPTLPLPPSAERAYRWLFQRVDGAAAMDTVRYMDQYWRLAGNPGFNNSIDAIRARLLAAGFAGAPEKDRPFVRIDEWGQPRGWDYEIGTVAFADGDRPGEVLLSRLRDRVSLCINSFPTPKEGVTARLVDVGSGDAASFDTADLKGAIVLGDADVGRLWQEAVKRGALGVISTRRRAVHPARRSREVHFARSARRAPVGLDSRTTPRPRGSVSRPAIAPQRACASA